MDKETEEQIKKIAKETLEVFGKTYTITYGSELLKKVIKDAKSSGKSEGPEFKLLSGPSKEKEAESKEPLKTGWMTKEGANVKSWKKRFFVVRPDYKIDYFDKEETYKAGGKPKGTIQPAGYKVIEESGPFFAKQLEELAAKLSLEASTLSPKTLPPNTLSLIKERRRDWFIQFESPEQKADWTPVFQLCCRKADALNSQDEVARAAFNAAFAATARARGYYSLWMFSGSEDQQLSDLIFFQLRDTVLDSVYKGLVDKIGNAKLRSMASEKADSAICSIVGGLVSAAWTAASKAVEAIRAPIEEKLKQNIGGALEAKDKLFEQLSSGISGALDPLLKAVLDGVASAILPEITSPVVSALQDLVHVFDAKSNDAVTAISAGQDDGPVLKEFALLPKKLSTLSSTAQNLEGLKKIASFAEKFDELKDIAEKVDGLVDSSLDFLRSLFERAVYTFHHLYATKTKEGKDKSSAAAEARTETHDWLLHDCNITLLDTVLSALQKLVNPPILKNVQSAVSSVLEPVKIPDFLKDIVNLEEEVLDTVVKIVGSALTAVIKPSLPAIN